MRRTQRLLPRANKHGDAAVGCAEAGRAGTVAVEAVAGARLESDAGAGQVKVESEVVHGSVEADDSPEIDDKAYRQVVQQLNRFGLELGRKAAEANDLTKENNVYSPLSASIALSMTYAGARAKTAQEFTSVLGGGIAPEVFHPGVNRLARELAARARDDKDAYGRPRKLELTIAYKGCGSAQRACLMVKHPELLQSSRARTSKPGPEILEIRPGRIATWVDVS